MLKKKIKCPRCKQIFEVLNPNDAEQLKVSCSTEGCGAVLRVNFATGHTVLTKSTKQEKGNGYLLADGKKMPLHEGLNVIGREADSSKADVQFFAGKKFFSREHLAIELVQLQEGMSKYILRDLRDDNKISQLPTLLNGVRLEKPDRIVLGKGDVIQVGELKMVFDSK